MHAFYPFPRKTDSNSDDHQVIIQERLFFSRYSLLWSIVYVPHACVIRCTYNVSCLIDFFNLWLISTLLSHTMIMNAAVYSIVYVYTCVCMYMSWVLWLIFFPWSIQSWTKYTIWKLDWKWWLETVRLEMMTVLYTYIYTYAYVCANTGIRSIPSCANDWPAKNNTVLRSSLLSLLLSVCSSLGHSNQPNLSTSPTQQPTKSISKSDTCWSALNRG